MGRRRGSTAFDHRFEAALDELQRFIAEHERMPSMAARDADELRLARWVTKRRWEAKTGRGYPNRIAEIDLRLPGWRVTTHSDEGFAAELEVCAAWVREHGKLPAMRARDPLERRFGKWLTSRRYDVTVDRLAPEREQALDEAIPHWNQATGTDGDFAHRLASCAAWISTNERMPSSTSSDASERAHAVWLSSRRRALSDGRLSADRIEMLNHAVPGWKDPRDAEFVAKLSIYAAWVWQNGRLPGSTGNVEEQRAYRWLARRRRDLEAGTLAEHRARLLDAAITGWSAQGARGDVLAGRVRTDEWVMMLAQPIHVSGRA